MPDIPATGRQVCSGKALGELVPLRRRGRIASRDLRARRERLQAALDRGRFDRGVERELIGYGSPKGFLERQLRRTGGAGLRRAIAQIGAEDSRRADRKEILVDDGVVVDEPLG